MITKGKYLTIRISEADIERIKADAINVNLSLTDYVLGKLECTNEIVPTTPLQAKNVPTKPTKKKVVRTVSETNENGSTITDHYEVAPKGDKKELKAIVTAAIKSKSATTDKLLSVLVEGTSHTIGRTDTIETIKTCASCSAKIKKGFLCDDCLK